MAAEAATALEALRAQTTVVADTGLFKDIARFRPQDATTNPSLLYAATQVSEYSEIVEAAIAYGKENGGDSVESQVSLAMDQLGVLFGCEILKLIPGRVSTEVDARLSFDTEGTVAKARELIALYEKAGVKDVRDRVLIKVAATWEGCEAARILEAEGIHVNMTLIFNAMQAAACAEAKATLISPFVGRITDFYKVKQGVDSFPVEEDPGVRNVREIFNYLKHHGYATVVMGASFRTPEQVLALTGCDLLTVAPALLDKLKDLPAADAKTHLDAAKTTAVPKLDTSQKGFRWALNEDDMTTEKLADGIRRFSADLRKLEDEITQRIKK